MSEQRKNNITINEKKTDSMCRCIGVHSTGSSEDSKGFELSKSHKSESRFTSFRKDDKINRR